MAREQDVLKKMDAIRACERSGDYSPVRRYLLEKRMGWLEKNFELLDLAGSDVRKAYQLILVEYMDLDPSEVPVVYEDEAKITWRSYNWCPILEACGRLEVDTRRVCKEGWEESVQKMVERINPKLKFSRNYSVLRPHGPYCEETVELAE